MIEPTDSEVDGVRERWAKRASLGEAVAVLTGTASVLLVGIAWLEGWPREAADWARRSNNSVLVEATVGVAGVIFTVVLLRLTRQSVRVAAQSVDIAATASAESEKRHKRELLPVVVLASFSEEQPRDPSSDDFEKMTGTWWERGVRIANTGPGVALRVDIRWSGVWMPNDTMIDVADDQPPPYLPSGAEHNIIIVPRPDMLRMWARNPEENPGAIFTESTDWGIGTLNVWYTDIYGQQGRTWCRVAMKTRDGRGEIVCKDIEIRLPGEDGP